MLNSLKTVCALNLCLSDHIRFKTKESVQNQFERWSRGSTGWIVFLNACHVFVIKCKFTAKRARMKFDRLIWVLRVSRFRHATVIPDLKNQT